MSVVRAGLKPAFGLLVLAHGLSHAAMPLRSALDSPLLAKDAMPAILFGVSVIGFVAAGLGALNLRPFTWMMRPLMVLASAYSLVAISRFGQGGLWWSAAADVVLLVTGLTAAYRFLPAPTAAEEPWHPAAIVGSHGHRGSL